MQGIHAGRPLDRGPERELLEAAARPYVDEIEFFGIPDVGARVNALMAGDVHMIGNVNPASARLILGAKGLKIMETKSGNYTNLIMRLDQAPGNIRTSCSA